MASCYKCRHFDVCYLSEIDNDIRDSGECPNCVHFDPAADLTVTDFLQMVENLCKYEYSLSYEKIKESVMRQVAARVGKDNEP